MPEVSQATAGKFPLGSRVRIELVRDGRTRYSPTVIRQAEDVFRLFREDAARWDREHFLVLLLDGRHRVLGVHEVSVGTLTASLVHPRLCVATHKRGYVVAALMWRHP
jgi:DNA repair protein RadC